MVIPSPDVTRAWPQTAEGTRSVVIVDDEQSYVESMAKLIADSLDCPVFPFTKASDALAGLAIKSAAVVVTDYSMPDMDGLEFIGEASRIAPGAAFIMISGHDLEPIPADLPLAKQLKLRLQKPVGCGALVAAILKAWPGDDVPAARR